MLDSLHPKELSEKVIAYVDELDEVEDSLLEQLFGIDCLKNNSI